MSNNFKKQAEQKRAAVPQIDLESVKPVLAEVAPVEMDLEPLSVVSAQAHASKTEIPSSSSSSQLRLTIVDTAETPTNRGFSMYPSRHRQVAKDLAYVEDRNPWEIIEDALEEYVVKHYGREYRRKS